MKPISTRIKSLIIAPEGEPIFSEMAMIVSIEDDAAGEYIQILQQLEGGDSKISIDPAEWPALRDAVDRMLAEIYRNKPDAVTPRS